jgi:hypothetical protein
MVDALRRAHRLVTAGGLIVDLHPTALPAPVLVGDIEVGIVDAGDAPLRHAAAGQALTTAVEEGLFSVGDVVDFDFDTFGDTIDELRDYVVATWRSARFDEATLERARATMVAGPPSVRPRVVERVRLTTLRPRPPTSAR